MFTKFSLLDWVACLLFSLFTLGLLIFYIERPVYNHDLSGYLGVVLSYEESDPKVVHSEVFDRLKKTVPPHRFERLVGAASDSAPAVRILGQDAEAFRQSLTFYEVRIAYTGLIFLLSKFGVEPIFASHAISAVSVFGSLWVFVFMFKGAAPFPYLFFLPLIALGIGLHELAQLSSPDALGLLWLVVGLSLFSSPPLRGFDPFSNPCPDSNGLRSLCRYCESLSFVFEGL